MGHRRVGARQVEQLEPDGLEEPLLSALAEVALLDDRREVELLPLDGVLAAVVVSWLELVVSIEIELPHVLAHGVAPDAAARPEVDVLVNPAVIDEGSGPRVLAPAVSPHLGVDPV